MKYFIVIIRRASTGGNVAQRASHLMPNHDAKTSSWILILSLLTDLRNEYNDLKMSNKKFLKTCVILVDLNASLRLTITCLYLELVVNYLSL